MKRLKRRLNKLRSCRGEMYVDTLISVFAISVVLAAFIAFFPVFIKKYELDMLTNEVSRFIAISGRTTVVDVNDIASDYNINIDDYVIEINPDAVNDGDKIQLAGAYSVTLKSHSTVGLGGLVTNFNIGLTSVAKGRSEVYWKELANATP